MAEQNTGLFTRLKRLFSTDVVIRNVGGNQLRTVDVDRIQACKCTELLRRTQG